MKSNKEGFRSKLIRNSKIYTCTNYFRFRKTITAIRISAIFVSFNEKHAVPHQLFFKQHKIREESEDRPSDLTLFVCNVPPYFNEVSIRTDSIASTYRITLNLYFYALQKCLTCLFQTCGSVKTVLFAPLETPSEVRNNRKESRYFDSDDEIKVRESIFVPVGTCFRLTVAFFRVTKLLTLFSNQLLACRKHLRGNRKNP